MSENLEIENVIALIGAPNSGKTTLYNWLTNSKFKTVNYPGSTVDYAIGKIAPQWNSSFTVVDTPGTYSLDPKSADEQVTHDVLFNPSARLRVTRAIVVVDGTQIQRHLLMAHEVVKSGLPCVIAITMNDILKKSNISIDAQALSKELGCPVVFTDGRLGGGIDTLIKAVEGLGSDSSKLQKIQRTVFDFEADKKKVDAIIKKIVRPEEVSKINHVYDGTARLDRWIMHPVFGVVIFLGIMFLLFSSIYWAATPFMDWIDEGMAALADFAKANIPEGLFADFITDGVLASIGAVIIFVPQIFILFIGMGFLEGSGYLARAATLIDKPLSKIGVSGRSFVPLLSGFACAIPAIMATRNLGSAREKLLAAWMIPLMSCSARLPVYALLLNFVFRDAPAWQPGLALTVIYLGSGIVGAVAGAVVNRIVPRAKKALFMMELPLYRVPHWKVVGIHALNRTKAYIKRAGPVIFVIAVIMWVGITFPNYKESPDVRMQTSYLGQVGQAIEPVFTPMGVDWKVGVSLITAFAAREVFVSSMALMYGITDDDEDKQSEGILKNMNEAKLADGTPIFTLPTVVGLILFFMIALQCMTTVGVAVREMNSWSFALSQLVVFNLVAYLAAVLVVQIF